MVSVIIPARKERYLNKTIEGLKENLKGDYEIIVTLDGEDEKRIEGVRYIYNKESKGMRTAINQAVEIAKGDYILKLDAHCMIDEEMDVKLVENHKDNWVQIPTRKRLNAKTWELEDRPDVNYMYLNKDFMGIVNRNQRGGEETETFQGSCYFMRRNYFKKLGLLDDVNFAGSGHEAQEICFKVKADGGKIIRNKKTWYAHARLGRLFSTDRTKSREYIKKLANELKST